MAKNTRVSYIMIAITPADENERTCISIHIDVVPMCTPDIAKGSVVADAHVPSQQNPKKITMRLSMQ